MNAGKIKILSLAKWLDKIKSNPHLLESFINTTGTSHAGCCFWGVMSLIINASHSKDESSEENREQDITQKCMDCLRQRKLVAKEDERDKIWKLLVQTLTWRWQLYLFLSIWHKPIWLMPKKQKQVQLFGTYEQADFQHLAVLITRKTVFHVSIVYKYYM